MMEKILFIDACVRPNSRTRALAQVVLQNLDGLVLAKNFYGIKDVQNIFAQGLDIAGNNAKAILEEAKQAALTLL